MNDSRVLSQQLLAEKTITAAFALVVSNTVYILAQSLASSYMQGIARLRKMCYEVFRLKWVNSIDLAISKSTTCIFCKCPGFSDSILVA